MKRASMLLLALFVQVTPRTGFAPLDVRVRLTIDPSPHNRQFCLTLDSDSPGARTYPGSCLGLDGERAARTREVSYKGLPPGEYRVYATLYTDDGHEERSKVQTITIK